MSFDLTLKPSCGGCGATTDLYGSNCKHLTLCSSCGKTMAQNRSKCYQCGSTLTRLIREYNVRTSSSNDKNYFIARFATGLPNFSKKKSADNNWTLQKEGLQGRQVTDTLREKYKNRPWLLEDETGQSQYHGHLEGSQSATYYLLMMQAKEFVAIPAGSWYNFNKVAQYKQLTLEEAEEKMKNRRKTADGYQRWMMKAANNGAAAFAVGKELEKDNPVGGGGSGGRGRKKSTGEDEGNASDKGEEDGEDKAARKARVGFNRSGDDDEDEGPRGGDFDDDDDNIEKGDDWEHEEIFTDDDEAVGNDPEEREDLFAPEVPAPPEIKEDDDEEEEEEGNEEDGGLSKSGKELKKLLGRANGLNDADANDEDDASGKKKKDEDDDDDDVDDEDRPSPVLTSKLKDPKEEPTDNSPAKPAPGGSSRGTPSSKSSKGKRKSSEDAKPAGNAAQKKVKTENEQKSIPKEDASKGGGAAKGTPSPSVKTEGPVSEEEIRAVLLQRAPITTSDLVGGFKARLKSPEDKKAFAEILKRISRIQKNNGQSYVVLRSK